MSLFATVEAGIKAFVERLDGEAVKVAKELEAEALTELHAVEAEVAKALPLIAAFKGELETVVATAAPEVKAAAEALVAKLVADFGALLGGAPAGM